MPMCPLENPLLPKATWICKKNMPAKDQSCANLKAGAFFFFPKDGHSTMTYRHFS